MTKKDEKIIEDAEKNGIPIFVLTAKDKLSRDIIWNYVGRCRETNCNPEHIESAYERYSEFCTWRSENEDKVKLPD